MIFVFDLDDTVCMTDEYSEYYINNFFVTHHLPYKQINKAARYAESKFDWDRKVALEWYKQYGDEMMLNFPCKPNAVELINTLHNNGHTIIIATARATDWHTDPDGITLQWLKNVGLKYSQLYVGRVDKELICDEVGADVFIDDDVEIVTRVAEHFAKKQKPFLSCLMTSLYNKDIPISDKVTRIQDFEHFAKVIEEQ